ncbi:MAG: endonuclease Q family protein [Candidatus Aminicenantes bacterium]|nr:endonuclease Q family protein [Candidatus Aminicenantes bacterium]
MTFIADLHIHSKYSRATSKDMTLDHLACWANVKGISLLGSGDFTHPEWLFLCKEKLLSTENGFFKLKHVIPPEDGFLQSFSSQAVRTSFVLSSEISLIYSKRGKVRKIHLLLLAPDFDTVDRINARLSAIGNLRSDGRPILGLDARDFLRLVSRSAPRCVVIPAHVWTPWFSLFGANSGFDTIEECFEEMTPSIFALETGLSSDPAMNNRLSGLDKYALVSNSDAHSPSKIGREANVFDTDFSFDGMLAALRSNDPQKFLFTVEFFPEEGKYYSDGHRKCDVILSPIETKKHNFLCPKCRKKLTVGVMHRLNDLADREPGEPSLRLVPFRNLIPLNEIIGQAVEKTAGCRSVRDLYFRFIHEFGNEFTILMETPNDDLKRISPDRIAEGIDRMRRAKVRIIPGHDGSFGRINLFNSEAEEQEDAGQLTLF